MRLTAANKDKIRKSILSGGAALFREKGYDGVNLDQVMESAGLTRGAFYAHFRSKQKLFEAVVLNEHPLLIMLQQRTGRSADELWKQLNDLFEGYLAPANLQKVFRGCTLASLTGDAARSPEPVKAAYEAAWAAIVEEMARGQVPIDRSCLRAALMLASGAVLTASSCVDPSSQEAILIAAHKGVFRFLQDARTATGEFEQC